jgi:hypothetical protein
MFLEEESPADSVGDVVDAISALTSEQTAFDKASAPQVTNEGINANTKRKRIWRLLAVLEIGNIIKGDDF